MEYNIISFYRYVSLKDPQQIKQWLHELCQQHHILGRILVAEEGINGAVCGTIEEIKLFKQKLETKFPNLTYRELPANTNVYHKLVVRVRSEIVKFGVPVNPNNKGTHLPPQQLKAWYDQKKQFTIIDARNDYEFDVGKFKNAVKMPIRTFREFPQAAQQLTHLKDQTVVLYCTGGIRCEKASAYLKEQGFQDVYQIEGGIINYVNQLPKTYWEGNLFVFDDRLTAETGEAITHCKFCNTKSGQYFNCHNLDCDAFFVSCPECRNKMNTTCSEKCKASSRQRPQRISKPKYKILGKVENYFPKVGAMSVIAQTDFTTGTTITINGKTTKEFTFQLSQLKDDLGNQIQQAHVGEIVSFLVPEKVRKNDVIAVTCSE